MDPHDKTELVILVKLCFCKEIPTVHQGETIAFAIIFGSVPVTQDDEGVLLMAGGSADASDGVDMVRHMLPFHLPFLSVASG